MALSLEQYRSYSHKKSPLNDILKKRSERERKRSLNVLIKNGDRIPEHLIVEILSRLPVKTLLQFKTVCKSWYDIIKSSYFATKHLRNYYDNDNNGSDCLIIQYEYLLTQGNEQALFELLIANKKNRTLEYEEIDFPMPICFYDHYLCGPCDGIYFLWCRFNDYPLRRNLWNPALDEVIILPDVTWKPNISTNEVFINESYGFGYDSKTEDYKVVLIWIYSVSRYETYNLIGHPMTILVYSLRTNSWRYWGDIDSYSYDTLERNGSYVFVNGCCYWLASRYSDNDDWNYKMIVAFDIAGDAYHEIPLPHFEVKPGYRSHLYVYRDSIAFVNIPNGYDTSCFSVWTWSEGVWTPMLSMKRNKGIWGEISLWRDNTTLVFTHWRRELVLYDTNTKEIFILDEPSFGAYLGILNICAYKESLVSIKGFQMQNKCDQGKESE